MNEKTPTDSLVSPWFIHWSICVAPNGSELVFPLFIWPHSCSVKCTVCTLCTSCSTCSHACAISSSLCVLFSSSSFSSVVRFDTAFFFLSSSPRFSSSSSSVVVLLVFRLVCFFDRVNRPFFFGGGLPPENTWHCEQYAQYLAILVSGHQVDTRLINVHEIHKALYLKVTATHHSAQTKVKVKATHHSAQTKVKAIPMPRLLLLYNPVPLKRSTLVTWQLAYEHQNQCDLNCIFPE